MIPVFSIRVSTYQPATVQPARVSKRAGPKCGKRDGDQLVSYFTRSGLLAGLTSCCVSQTSSQLTGRRDSDLPSSRPICSPLCFPTSLANTPKAPSLPVSFARTDTGRKVKYLSPLASWLWGSCRVALANAGYRAEAFLSYSPVWHRDIASLDCHGRSM